MSQTCIQDLEEIRQSLHHFFSTVTDDLIDDLLGYANTLDAAYKAIKISKVAGQAGAVVGGVLGAIGFGLAFVTFGASLGLCIAGGVIGGAGGITAGGASAAQFYKAKKARKMAHERLTICDQEFKTLLEKCNEVSEELERMRGIERRFPAWKMFWIRVLFGSGQAAAGFGWKLVANTVINAVRFGRGIDVAMDATSAALPVFRTLGNVGRGFHIAGGVIGAVFLPVDLFFLVSDSIELHRDKAHGDATRIREIVVDIKKKTPSAKEIDSMIDSSIAAIHHVCPDEM